MPHNKISNSFAWITGEIFATGVLLFSVDLLKAFLLGIVGGLGGLVVKVIYNKWLK